MRNVITITVEAPAGGGKSTVARIIRDALNASGIEAGIIGPEAGDFVDEYQADRAALVGMTSIVEIQTRTKRRRG
jgi:cytidylate kinase